MFFHPKVVYRDPNEPRNHSIVRYIGNRVLRNNRNFLCAVVGPTGVGKSWSALSMAELYANMHGIKFDPEVHIIYSLRELLKLITDKDIDKKIRFGSVIVFDEPQIEANARNWQSEVNNILNQLISTFRNQRLVIFFCTPYLEFIDKQSRILFHGEFTIEGFDKDAKITTVKPRFLDFNKNIQDFYRKRLIVYTATERKTALTKTFLNQWKIPKASDDVIEVYERKKKIFTDELNKRLQKQIESATEEKKEVKRESNDDFFNFMRRWEETNGDTIKIMRENPTLTPFKIENFLKIMRKSKQLDVLTN